MRFIVTAELGRLVTWMRILGFDTVLEKERRSLVLKSLLEERVILTRDAKMSRFTGTRMLKITSDFVDKQLEQVITTLGLPIDRKNLFTRCVLCNAVLRKADKDSVKGSVPDYVFRTQEAFMQCPACGKAYWRGTHWELANRFLDRIRGEQP